MTHSRSKNNTKQKITSSKELYAQRRKKVLQTIKSDAIIIIPSHPISHRNNDTEYLYRQDSNFYYLTGFNEPESIAVFAPGRKEGEYILFNRPRDPQKETWTGKREGQDGAIKKFGADQSFPINEFKEKLSILLKGRTTVYYPMEDKDNLDKEVEKIILNTKINGKTSPHFKDISNTLASTRLIKDKEEIALIKKAVSISEKGHLSAMQHCKPGMYEYQLEAKLMHEFLNNGSHALAYPNIVASGENSCILHYEENDKQIKEGDLVLIDAGAEYRNYASDITRTFPANGKFTKEQRAIYDLVLKAQENAIKAIAPGKNWEEIEAIVQITLTQGLIDLGILQGDLEYLLEQDACRNFYMHGSGHWMGLDVHDVGSLTIPFAPGMVHTIEPGIYIKPSPNVDKRWHNIGIRIEDDILVTKNGCEVLSCHLPKKADEIEKMMAQSNALTSTAKSINLLQSSINHVSAKEAEFKTAKPKTAELIKKQQTDTYKTNLFNSSKHNSIAENDSVPIANRLRRIKTAS